MDIQQFQNRAAVHIAQVSSILFLLFFCDYSFKYLDVTLLIFSRASWLICSISHWKECRFSNWKVYVFAEVDVLLPFAEVPFLQLLCFTLRIKPSCKF